MMGFPLPEILFRSSPVSLSVILGLDPRIYAAGLWMVGSSPTMTEDWD